MSAPTPAWAFGAYLAAAPRLPAARFPAAPRVASGLVEAAEGFDAVLSAVDALRIELDAAPDGPRVVAFARRHRLTAYDALYLELALRRGEGLTSLDAALIRAAEAKGVRVLDG